MTLWGRELWSRRVTPVFGAQAFNAAASSALRLVMLLAAGLVNSASPARADPYSEFVYCAPPTRPGCVDTPSGSQRVCEDLVEAYVTSVFKYRECLEREMERAVREANKSIADVKCRSDKANCRQ